MTTNILISIKDISQTYTKTQTQTNPEPEPHLHNFATLLQNIHNYWGVLTRKTHLNRQTERPTESFKSFNRKYYYQHHNLKPQQIVKLRVSVVGISIY